MRRMQERVALNNEHKQKTQLSRGIVLEKARAPGSIVQPLSPHAKANQNAWPPNMNLAGTDMVLLTAAKRDEVNWWWTCCNTYNPRSGERHYTESELARPYKIGSEDSRLSAEKLGRETAYIAKTFEQNKPPVTDLSSKKGTPIPGSGQSIPQHQLLQMPSMLSEIFNKQRSRTSQPAAHTAPSNNQSSPILRGAPDINSSSRELSVAHHPDNTRNTFPGTRPAYRSESVPLVGSMTAEWERQSVFMPRNEKTRPPGSRPRSRGSSGSVSYKACGMHVTPAMLQPLPGSHVLTPIAYRVPKMDPGHRAQQRPSPVQPPTQLPTTGQQQHRNFPSSTDFSQIKPFSRLD